MKDPAILPTYKVPSIEDIEVLEIKGPWQTKSGGELNVLFALPQEVLESRYFNYEDEELAGIPRDIRGLRAYAVGNIGKGSVGAQEVHKVRNELTLVLDGAIRWTCEDLYGNKKEYILDAKTALWTPPYVLHTYEGLKDNNRVMVIANTLFDPEDPQTFDSFSEEVFRELQRAAQANA